MSFLEEFKIILQNKANRVLGVVDIEMGGKAFVHVDMKVIFSIALKASSSRIILVHNYSSGKLDPSAQDKALTNKVVEAGKVLDIEICDHKIMSEDAYYSIMDERYF